MTHALLAGGAAFLLALIVGRQVVAWLCKLKLGKAISIEGPSSHASKSGTPTMGGLLIFGAVAVVIVFSNLFDRLSILLPLVVVGVTMGIGAYDDLGTLVGGNRRGLSWRVKFVFLMALSIWVAYVL